MAYVYILQGYPGNRYYIGSTTNLDLRIKHHQGGHTPSTKRLGKITMVFSQKYTTLKEAREIERKLKAMKRHDYIEKIVRDGHIKIKP